MSVIEHTHNSDRVDSDKSEGVYRGIAEDEDIEGVAVIGVGSGDKSVVCGVVGSGIEQAVESEHTCFFIEFVFTVTSFGDLDNCGKIIRSYPRRVYVVQDIHKKFLSFHRN